MPQVPQAADRASGAAVGVGRATAKAGGRAQRRKHPDDDLRGIPFNRFDLADCGAEDVEASLRAYSLLSRQLTAEQIEAIRRALEDFDWLAAIKRYREAVPDAGYAPTVPAKCR